MFSLVDGPIRLALAPDALSSIPRISRQISLLCRRHHLRGIGENKLCLPPSLDQWWPE
jgi:hypothetical protein